MGLFGFVKKTFKSSVVRTLTDSLEAVLTFLEMGIKSVEDDKVTFEEFVGLMKALRDMVKAALGKDQA